MSGRLGLLVITALGILFSGGLLFYALMPIDQAAYRGDNVTGVVRAKADRASAELTVPVPRPAGPQTGSVARVYVRESDGSIVRSGESVPALQAVSDEARGEIEALRDWETLVREYTVDSGRRVSMKDEIAFRKALLRLPNSRRRESLQYAVNVIPDENFALIARLAVSLDLPPELITTAFDACLNRTCASAKQAIREIAKEKRHPNYVDAARMVDLEILSKAH